MPSLLQLYRRAVLVVDERSPAQFQTVWQQVFNFRVLASLDKAANQWLLAQWMSHGINSIKTVA
ncbi:hypothetical protein [Nostoc sp. DSM 114161]|uniref:hypothetical protein n=1 Tax=Nostoc sp. DSM 114161 TaxID=3440143 RepID=UPI00404545F1